MIRIEAIESEPIAELPYLNARSGGGTESSRLAFRRARVDALADELDAIVCCSDLQGFADGALLGIAVANQLAGLAEAGVLPRAQRTGIVLCGDMYARPGASKRGGFGDVADVWYAFAEHFAWVVGVAGNHDDVTAVRDIGDHVHLLDGDSVVVDGIRFGGVGRAIMGTTEKPGRRPEADQLAHLATVIDQRCDVLLLHEGPHGDDGQIGHPAIRERIETGGVGLTVCGHRHWDDPLATHTRGQILNVDARVVVLASST